MAVYTDPLDVLDNPELRSPEFFGQMSLQTWFCVLEKGIGKRDFDPNKDGLDARRTAVKLMLVPLPEHNSKYDVMRELIVESKEWAGLVLPSIKALGISARELEGKWLKVGFQPTGRTYTKADQQTGETVTKDATTFKFLALYPNEEACRAAYLTERGSHPVNGNGNGHAGSQTAAPAPAQTTAPAQGGNGNGGAVDAERTTALKFVKVLINQTGGDADALSAKMASMPMIAKHFTVHSPEVVNLIGEYEFAKLAA
jgi:hypothetical protein